MDDILLTPYIRKIAADNSKKAENIETKCKKIIGLGTSLSLFSILNFHNVDSRITGKMIYGNLRNWLGFDTEIKDLLIYSGAPFWERIRKSLLIESIITCIGFTDRFSHIVSSAEIENLEAARHEFIAHFDANPNNEKTRGYIETLYSTFNKFVEDFNSKHNKDPYYLYIDFEEYHYILPEPHTGCDKALRNILRLINSEYHRYKTGQ